MKPGRVSSAERAAPPAVSFASRTRTEWPACAMVIAAARPFGPAPTITASNFAIARSGEDALPGTQLERVVRVRRREAESQCDRAHDHAHPPSARFLRALHLRLDRSSPVREGDPVDDAAERQ